MATTDLFFLSSITSWVVLFVLAGFDTKLLIHQKIRSKSEKLKEKLEKKVKL